MNEELARIVFEAFHLGHGQREEGYRFLPFYEICEENKEVWSEVGEAAIKWYLKNRKKLHGPS
jgi:hypothetical protein